jgi:hypothetical protein
VNDFESKICPRSVLQRRFFQRGISDTVPHRLLLQAGSKTTMITT